MARLGSRENHGYYPTPDVVTRMIATHIKPAAQNMVWLDPSAGEGIALANLATLVGNKPVTHGVELDISRAQQCETRLDEVVQTDANQVTFPRNGYDLVWFNPEYGESRVENEEGDKRLSQTLFRSAFVHPNNVLVPGGLFIGILKYSEIAPLVNVMWRHFQGPNEDDETGRSYPLVFRFPDPEYEAFEQYVILGRKRKPVLSALPKEVEEAVLAGIEHETYPQLTYAPEPLFTLPQVPVQQQGHMRTKVYKPAHGAQIALKHGWGTRPTFTARYWPAAEQPTRPVLPLQKAHMAQLLASGAIRAGIVFDTTPEGGKKYLIRGRQTRHQERLDEEKNAAGKVVKYTVRETFDTEMLVIDDDGVATRYKVTDKAEKQAEEGIITHEQMPDPLIRRDTDSPYSDMNSRMI